MLLCAVGQKGGHIIYTLGEGTDYWERWIDEKATAQDRLDWTALVIATAKKARSAVGDAVCARVCVSLCVV